MLSRLRLKALKQPTGWRKSIFGLALNGEPEAALRTVVMAMTDEYYQELSDALKRIPTTELADTVDSCRQLIDDLAELNTSSRRRQ